MTLNNENIGAEETKPTGWWSELHLAAAFLTHIPMFRGEHLDHGALAPAMKFFPLVGALVGFLSGAAYWVMSLLGLPPVACALVALVVLAWITGALHEDGLADTADGFGGGHDKDSKLAAMRDSHVGAFGLMAVVFAIGLRASALVAIADPFDALLALMAAGALSRALMPLAMRVMPPATESGLAASGGRPDDGVAMVAVALAAVILLLTHGPGSALSLLALGAVAVLAMSWLAKRQIGGYTGDVLGALGVVTEILVLLALAAAP